jgi:DNA-binding PadR family transcriptional regulator
LAKENTTRFALLGLLTFGPASGYELKTLCDRTISHFWNENYGHIYPVLKELAKEELVTADNETKVGRPPKTVYSITDKGMDELRAWLAKPIVHTPPRVELLLKIVFSGNVPRSKVLALLEDEIKNAQETITKFEGLEDHLKNHIDDKNHGHKNAKLWLASVDYGKRFNRMHLGWCEDQLRSLRKSENRK